VIGPLEDAEDYTLFEAAIIADYGAQSAVERELVLRLASLLWRLRRTTTMETGLFEIQADHLSQIGNECHVAPQSREIVYAIFGQSYSADADNDPSLSITTGEPETPPCSDRRPAARRGNSSVDIARCFLRLTNLPNFALDRLSRYEAALWRQVDQTLFALDALDRRKPQERGRRSGITNHQESQAHGRTK
jgi:hypothetical protein